MPSEPRTGLFLVAIIAVGVGAFLYNKQLNLETERQRFAAEQQLHQRVVKCGEDGKKFAAELLAQRSALMPREQSAWDDPEFHYSVELGTCLVKTRFVTLGYVTYQHARVTDVSTNKSVIESYVKLTTDPDKTDGSLKEEASDLILGRPNLARSVFYPRADALMKK